MPVPPPLMIAPNTRRLNLYLILALLATGLSGVLLWLISRQSVLATADLLSVIALLMWSALSVWTTGTIWLLRRKGEGLRIDQKGIHVPGFKLRWDLIRRLRYQPADELSKPQAWGIGIKLTDHGLQTARHGALGWSAWLRVNPFVRVERTANRQDDLVLNAAALRIGPATARQIDQTLKRWTAQYGIQTEER